MASTESLPLGDLDFDHMARRGLALLSESSPRPLPTEAGERRGPQSRGRSHGDCQGTAECPETPEAEARPVLGPVELESLDALPAGCLDARAGYLRYYSDSGSADRKCRGCLVIFPARRSSGADLDRRSFSPLRRSSRISANI